MEANELITRLETTIRTLEGARVKPKRFTVALRPTEADLLADALDRAHEAIALVRAGELDEAHRHLGFIECSLIIAMLTVARKSA